MKMVFQSEFLSTKSCNVLGNVSPQLWSQFVYIPACLLDISGYPAFERVLGPAVILGLGSVELFLKKKKKKKVT